jgi:uncharacterized protein (DUF2235 family)
MLVERRTAVDQGLTTRRARFSFVAFNSKWLLVLLAMLTGLAAASGLYAADAGQTAEPSALSNPAAKRRLVLCLDGTWNSTFDKTRTHEGTFVLKPTNVLKLCRSVRSVADDGVSQIIFYLTGVGSVPRYPGAANTIYSTTDRYLGGIWGAGFESNVEAALDFLNMNYRDGDEVYIFGFSRGAATARGVTQFLGWAHGLPTREDAYYLPLLFRHFIEVRGEGGPDTWIAEVNADRAKESTARKPLEPFNNIPVTYLGVWDTVMALGSRFESTGVKNATVSQSFYVDEQPAVPVAVARQALAIDERRFDFRPEIWNRARPGQSLMQRWFPGVHSNVGGGYRYDGLANGALHWLVAGAVDEGLDINDAFLSNYRRYPQDKLYDSYSLGMDVMDTIRFRRGDGVRALSGRPASANLSVDRSAVVRLLSDPQPDIKPEERRYRRMDGKAYRPDNLLSFLACSPEAARQVQRGGDDMQRLTSDPILSAVLTEMGQECP